MNATPCQRAIAEAAKDSLSPEDMRAAFDRVEELKKAVEAEGAAGSDMRAKLKAAVQREAEKTKIAAALQRKHAALNAIVRDRLDAQIDSLVSSGLSLDKAILAIMEGTQRGVKGGRKSVNALRLAYETRFNGQMLAAMEREVPHVPALFRDDDFADDVVREMAELKDGGNPGVSKNPDAQKIAKVMATYAEATRVEMNRLGASIGKLDGWAGPQNHDQIRIAKTSTDDWVDFILPRLDIQRSFPDAKDLKEVQGILRESYDTIVTGVGKGLTAGARGKRVGPANLAKKLGQSRVFHFKDANSWIEYNRAFGVGNVFHGIASHQRKAAHLAAQMEVFGPNPEVMLTSIVETRRLAVRNDKSVTPAKKTKLLEALDIGKSGFGGSRLANAYLEMSGLLNTPGTTTMARIGSGVRSVQGMSKLGGAVATAIPTDIMTEGAASMFRGGGFLGGLVNTMEELFAGRSSGERRQIGLLINEGADDLISEMSSPYAVHDGAPGFMTKASETFHKLSGLTGWTERKRMAGGRVIASEMAMRAAKDWNALPPRYRHVLELNDITAEKWKAIRQAKTKLASGKDYITPDAMDALPDSAVEHLIAGRLDQYKATGKRTAEQIDAKRTEYLNDARRGLFLDVARFFADEVNYGTVEMDAAANRITKMGTRPGTMSGEIIRFIMQFKGFPIAFSQRILGRAFFGGAGGTAGERFLNNLPHIGALMAGLTAAGYLSMTAKDIIKGKWPPRDPASPKVIAAAMLQGGAFGIYGDFLFGEANRFGNSALETAAGPFFGSTASGLINAYQKTIHGDPKGAEWLNLAISNTPYANLWYAKPVADFLFLNSMREWANPGYRARQETRMRKETGQSFMFPSTFGEAMR